jgi:hypothetical protein
MNPAPNTEAGRHWGDRHFGSSLESAFARKGAVPKQQYWPEWERHADEDIVIVLHGLRSYRPPAGKFNILWVMSHPALLTKEELDSYDLIYAGSELLAFLLESVTSKPVKVLRQCTDTTRFHPGEAVDDSSPRSGVIFVSNARGIRRNMACWGSQMADNFLLYGRGWKSFGLDKYVKDEAVPNDELGDLYRRAWLGLNDHWLDMRDFGIINNRIFDSVACGLPVITDSFPELRSVFGDTLLYADSREDFEIALRDAKRRYPEISAKVQEFWKRNGHLYSFDARAAQILEDIEFYTSPREPGTHRPKACPGAAQSAILWQAIKENAVYHAYQMKNLDGIARKAVKELEECRGVMAVLQTSILWKLARWLRNKAKKALAKKALL